MPEVERPRALQGRKALGRSYGKGGSAERGVVQFWEGWTERGGIV